MVILPSVRRKKGREGAHCPMTKKGAAAGLPTDIRELSADPAEPLATRVPRLLEQLGDPYHFRWDSVSISVGYSSRGPTLESALIRCLAAMKNP